MIVLRGNPAQRTNTRSTEDRASKICVRCHAALATIKLWCVVCDRVIEQIIERNSK